MCPGACAAAPISWTRSCAARLPVTCPWSQLPLATECVALALGPLNAFLAALPDQAALELGNAAHDRQHQPANLRGRVAPAFPKRYQATGLPLKFVQDVVQVAARRLNSFRPSVVLADIFSL
jgi:hypothetical protein